MKLILKEKKKKELEKLLNVSYIMNDLKKYVYYLRNLSATSNKNEDIIRDISKYTHLAKEKIEQFTSNVKCLMEKCIIYTKNYNHDENNLVNNNRNNKTNWKLKFDEKSINNIVIANNDFEISDSDKNIYIKYLLIYNNLNNSYLSKLLISVLDMFEIIIKGNMDITLIITKFRR